MATNDSDKEIPFNQLFLLGGANSLRGFDWYTVGKRRFSLVEYNKALAAGDPDPDNAALRPFGGRQQFYYNLEFQFPMIQEAGVMGVVFYDIGNADDDLTLSECRDRAPTSDGVFLLVAVILRCLVVTADVLRPVDTALVTGSTSVSTLDVEADLLQKLTSFVFLYQQCHLKSYFLVQYPSIANQ